jgi:hypothetical protein
MLDIGKEVEQQRWAVVLLQRHDVLEHVNISANAAADLSAGEVHSSAASRPKGSEELLSCQCCLGGLCVLVAGAV